MELQYIWIDNFFSIQDQEFNFDKKFSIAYNRVVTGLDINKSEKKFSNNFWGDKRVVNVNAIIGQNGAGKTTLFHYLYSYFGNLHAKSLLVFKKIEYGDPVFYIYTHEGLGITEKNIRCPDAKFKLAQFGQNSLDLDNHISLLFLSNAISQESFRGRVYAKDISTTFLMEEANKKTKGRSVSQYAIYNHEELKKQSAFILNKPADFGLEFLNSIRDVGFYFPLLDHVEQYKNLEQFAVLKTISKVLVNETPRNSNEKLSGRHLVHDDNLAKSLLVMMVLNTLFKAKEYDIFKQVVIRKLGRISGIPLFITSFKNNVLNDKDTSKELSSFFGFILNKIKRGNLRASTSENLAEDNFGYNAGMLQFDLKLTLFKEFIELYEDTIKDGTDYINFKWRGLSTGESAYLSNFARLFNVKDELNKNAGKTLIIMIDEVDLYLHPQWQKEYIDRILKFLPKNFNHKEIQLILTSHSPIIVSDIPKSSIVFLARDSGSTQVVDFNKAETFSSNIHTLFKDSFIINNGLIGDFARNKINDFFKWAQNIEDKRPAEEFEQLMNLVEEPIIKIKLFEAFAKKTGGDVIEFRLKAQKKVIDEKLNRIEGNRKK